MGTTMEVIHHSEHFLPALRVELFSYLGILLLTILMGMLSIFLKRA